MRKRRQDVLVSLGAAAVLTLLATVAFGGPLVYLHLLVDLLLVAYLGALVWVGATTSPAVARSVHPARRARPVPAPRSAGARSADVLAPRPAEPRRLAN